MILIGLEYGDLIICVRTCSIVISEIRIYRWLRGFIYRGLED